MRLRVSTWANEYKVIICAINELREKNVRETSWLIGKNVPLLKGRTWYLNQPQKRRRNIFVCRMGNFAGSSDT